jgi:hypothetical protein
MRTLDEKIILNKQASCLLVLRLEIKGLFMKFIDAETVNNDELKHQKKSSETLNDSRRQTQIEESMTNTDLILRTINQENDDEVL